MDFLRHLRQGMHDENGLLKFQKDVTFFIQQNFGNCLLPYFGFDKTLSKSCGPRLAVPGLKILKEAKQDLVKTVTSVCYKVCEGKGQPQPFMPLSDEI